MSEPMTNASRRTLRLLDAPFHLEAEDPSAFELLDVLYAAPEFTASPSTHALHARFRRDDGDPQSLWVEHEGRSSRVGTSPDWPLEVAEWTFRQALVRSRDFLIVHAGALRHRGQGILVVGPPFAGKTTLTLALAAEGMEYLSDDVGAIARSDARLHPFRRRAGVRRPGGGRDYLMPGSQDGRPGPAPEPCSVGWVFILDVPRPSLPGRAGAWTLIVEPDLEADLASVAAGGGLAILARSAWGGGIRFDFAPVEGSVLARAIQNCLGEEPAGILYLGPTPRDWSGLEAAIPAIRPMGGQEAAEEVLRHLLNRAGQSDLAERYGPHPHLKMLAEIYRCLAAVRSCRVVAGDPTATARALLDHIAREAAAAGTER